MITKIRIQNYKSLEDVTLIPGPLTVLVGPNGSGKSNILDALKFVKELITFPTSESKIPIPYLLSSRGGPKAVVWGGHVERDISIDLAFHSKRKEESPLSFFIKLGEEKVGARYRRFIVKEEKGRIGSGLTLSRIGSEIIVSRIGPGVTLSKTASRPTLSRNDEAKVSIINGLNTQVGDEYSSLPAVVDQLPHAGESPEELFSVVSRWAFYNFDPRIMKPPQPVRSEYLLNEIGDNLSTVIHAYYSDGNLVLRDILDTVKASDPSVTELLSPISGDGKTQVALRYKDVVEAVNSWGISDGTLFSLALATALLTPKVPALLALESPDTSLHPYVMEHIAELLKSASKKTQVIVTTHSPYLLDYVPPESIVVVEKVKGKTVLKPVKGRRGVKYAIEKLGAGEAWYSGQLGGVP